MTKSAITREQLIKKAQEQIEFCRHTKITGEGRVHVNQCAALFEIALAAIDSEPVAEVLSNRQGNDTSTIDRALPVGTQLYRHAQPAPVVPDALIKAVDFYEQVKRENPPIETGAWKDAVDWVLKEACRAAMLQAGNSPVIGIDLASGPDRSVEVRYVAPPGYVMVPKEPTPEILATITEAIRAMRGSAATYARVLAAAPQEVK